MRSTFIALEKSRIFHFACKRVRLPAYLRDQLLRASASITLNLAEGSAKFTEGDQRRFYGTAYGSAVECEAIISLADNPDPEAKRLAKEMAAMTYVLARCPQKTRPPEPSPASGN